jgi:hypothetical protein
MNGHPRPSRRDELHVRSSLLRFVRSSQHSLIGGVADAI